MGVANTRTKIANQQSCSYREALALCKAHADEYREGKGSHMVFSLNETRLVLSQPKGGQLHRYQIKQVDEWLRQGGK